MSLLLLLLLPLALALDPSSLEALRLGDCGPALSEGRAGDDADRLALGRCQIRAGQPQLAADTLAAIQEPGLAAYGRLLEGEALIAAGKPAEAVMALSGLALTGDPASRARQLLGRALIESGRPTEGRDQLRGMLSGSFGEPGALPSPWGADPAEVRWWLAENAVVRGEPEAAVPVWRSLWSKNPTSPRADEAARRLAAQGSPVPDAATPDGQTLIEERIKTLRKLQRFAEALALRQLLPPPGSESERAELARMYFEARDYKEAAAAYGALASPGAATRFQQALALSRIGEHDAAAEVYSEILRSFPDSSQAITASYKLGYLRYDAGDLEGAIPELRAHLRRYPKSSESTEARWFIAWSLYRLDRLQEAGDAFQAVLGTGGDAVLSAGAAWWLARIQERQGDPAGAQAAFLALRKRYSDTGYAWLADQRLGRTYPRAPVPSAPSPAGAWAGASWTRGTSLARVGLDGWARAELLPLVGAARASGHDDTLALADALVQAGAYAEARALARPWCGDPASGTGEPLANRICWPRPGGELLERRAAEGGIPRLLPNAIMNAESGLRPEVTSPAGARGIMQLMPDLGSIQHTQLGLAGAYDPDQLYQPGYNALLGTTELISLHSSLADTGVNPLLPLVIAGYNGGEEAVRRWRGDLSLPPPDADRYAEDIGYTETRRYVRRVLGYLQVYRYVYGD